MTKPKHPSQYVKRGRPGWDYEEGLATDICTAIATTTMGLDRLCAEHPEWPSPKVIYKWVLSVPAFGLKYAQARELQQEVRVNYAYERAHNNENDMYPDDKGIMRPNMAAIARDKLLTDTIKWEAGRLSRKYREKQQVENHNYTHEDGLKDLG